MQVTVSDKGQITLPQALRQLLRIEPGSKLELDTMADGSLRIRLLERGSQGLAGLLARPGDAVRTLDDMDQAIASAVTERSSRVRRTAKP
ncbi:MAG: AbrB/MazE/SpoVT family DNA-binding domain-containing protein [Leptothrix sp. (in: b-proteobacteria)]